MHTDSSSLMIFALQKILWFLLMPLSVVLILLIIGLVLNNGNQRLGRLLTILAVLLLYLLSLDQTAYFILKTLEEGYPPLKNEKITVDAVVVPGGGSVDLEWINADPVPNAETLSRMVTGVEWAKRLRVPLVLCGGNGESFATKINDADAMAPSAYAMGMPKEQVVIENVSRNTLENAYAVRKLIKGDRIVLATSAYYMRRAMALFTRRGFKVTPAPTYFLAQTRTISFNSFIPKASDLYRSSVGLAEWVNMAWWYIRGEI